MAKNKNLAAAKKAKNPNYSDLNAGPAIFVGGVLKNTYPRILLQRKWE